MESVLSPKELAQAIGVSESSLKRWTDEGRIPASRTAGGHRRIRTSDAIRFIREARLPVVRPELLGLGEGEQLQAPESDAGEALYGALQHGDIARAKGIIAGAYLDGQPLPAIFDGPVRHALAKIGELWQHSNDGIFIEHRAIDICVQALSELRSIMPTPDDDAPKAMGAAPPGDPYMIPSIMAAMVVREAGFNTVNLGPDTPLDVLGAAAERAASQLVWLSVTAPTDPRMFQHAITRLGERLAALDATLLVGGRQFDTDSLILPPNVQQVGSMGELSAYAKGLRTAHQRVGHAPHPADKTLNA